MSGAILPDNSFGNGRFMVTLALIVVNVAVSLVAFSAFRRNKDTEKFLFIPLQVASGENLIGMVLSNFSHKDISHLVFNMLSFYFFAPVVEELLGPVQLLVIYIVSGAAAILLTFLFHRTEARYRALGASGSVSGVIFAAIVLYPGMSLYVYFVPIPIPGPVFVLGYLALSIYLAKRQLGNIGHEAHIGGAVAGFILSGLFSPSGFAPLVETIRELLP
jgi:membrane associated rhomboid family serine protease